MKIKVAFLDVRDTMGYIDSPGHLTIFKPTTLQLLKSLKEDLALRIGVITNLPENITHDQGVKMIEEAGLLDYIKKEDIISSHLAGSEKPDKNIYEFACNQMGVNPDEAMYISENLIEILGANAAGIKGVLKPFPPARDFIFKSLLASPGGKKDAGRLAEALMEEEHIIGKRIVVAAVKILEALNQKKNVSHFIYGNLIFLLKNYVDKFHHKKEEEILLPFARSRGVSEDKLNWVIMEHDQGRCYFKAIEIAYDRLRNGDEKSLYDIKLALDGFINLYKSHGPKEDDILLPEIGNYLSDLDDAIIIDFYASIGPHDLTPYLALLSQTENEIEKLLPQTENENK